MALEVAMGQSYRTASPVGHWPEQVLTFVEGLKGKMFNNDCESAGIRCVVRFYANVSILAKFTFTQ